MPIQHIEPLLMVVPTEQAAVVTLGALGVLGVSVVARWLRQDAEKLSKDNRELRASEAAAWLHVRNGTDAINDAITSIGRLADLYHASNEIQKAAFAEVTRELHGIRKLVEGHPHDRSA